MQQSMRELSELELSDVSGGASYDINPLPLIHDTIQAARARVTVIFNAPQNITGVVTSTVDNVASNTLNNVNTAVDGTLNAVGNILK